MKSAAKQKKRRDARIVPFIAKNKRKPIRKQSKNTISKLKREAWKVFSLWIRNRDNWICYTCGAQRKGAGMHAGHFVPRSHNSTLFDPMNNHAQCATCNIWKRGEPGIYASRLLKEYGREAFEDLVKRGRETKQFKPSELEEIIKKYAVP